MKETLNEVVARLGRSIEQFPWEDQDSYVTWLAQTYYYVAHSTRLLAAAAARMPFSALGNQLHHRCAAHMAEEKKHELLAAHDLAALGRRVEAFPELPATRILYEPQYMKIEHVSPIALFGYILTLEAMSATHGPMNLERVVPAHGEHAAAFLTLHAREDQGHVAKALASLASLDESDCRIVLRNIEKTGVAYELMLSCAATPRIAATRSYSAVRTAAVG